MREQIIGVVLMSYPLLGHFGLWETVAIVVGVMLIADGWRP